MRVDWWSFLYLALAYLPAVLVHELGHAVAARWFGATDVVFQLGNPADRLVQWQLGWIRLKVYLGVRLWFTVPTCRWSGGRKDPAASLVRSLAGPGASLVLGLALWPCTAEMWSLLAEGMQQGRFGYTGRTWLDALAVATWYGVLIPLVPLHYHATGLDSDGLQAWKALKGLAKG